MSDFEKRLQRAIQRGEHRSNAKAREARAREIDENECKQLHTKYRLQLSEQIESCIRRLPEHFPGFQFETIYGERGWGAACGRDDFGSASDGTRTSYYSRLEMTVRPYSPLHVLDLAAKGTIRNKEVFNRNYFEKLSEVDPETFTELIDLWVLEYAEQYAAKL